MALSFGYSLAAMASIISAWRCSRSKPLGRQNS
jgi:hypothetical protein